MAMFWLDEEKNKGYNTYLKNKKDNGGKSFEINQGKKYEGNFKSTSAKKGSKSYDWEKSMLHDLPKEYGKSYNEKFTTLSKELGVEDEHDFRKYLDAQEKGALISGQINEMLLESNEKGRVDFIKRSSGMNDEGEEKTPTKQPPRTTLDRVFDPLLVFNYASAGLAMGFADNGSDDDQNPISRAWKGIKSANPFGEGNVQNEYTYSKVFEEMGWKPTSTAGKVAKGGLGFVGDVLLDPTTYLTLGTGAVIKGGTKAGAKGASKATAKEIAKETGSKYTKVKDTEKFVEASRKAHIEKLAKENPEVSHDLIVRLADKKAGETRKAIQLAKGEMTEDLAKGIVTDTIAKRGLDVSEQQVAKDVQSLMSEYNRAKGIKQRTGITLSLANAPFGEQIFKSWADKKLTLVSGETLAKTSDKLGVSKGYNTARNAFLGSKLGGMFSTTSKLKKLADEDPSKLYDYLKFVEITKGRQLNKLGDEREIQAVGKQLAGLSPAEQKELTELMQDKTVWHKISKTIKLSDTLEARRIRKDLVNAQKAAQADLDTLATNKNNLEGLQHANDKLLFDTKDELDILRGEYRAKLADVDLKHVQDDAQLEEYMAMFRQEAQDLQAETFKLGQRTKRANKRSEELEQMGSELVTKQADDVAKLDASKEADVNALRDETRAGRDEINAEIGAKQTEIESRQAENKKFEEEGLVDPSTYAKYFEMNEGYSAQKKAREEFNQTKQGEMPNVDGKIQLIRQLNNDLFEGDNVLSLGMMDGSVEKLMKLMQEGKSPDAIKQYVSQNPRMFSKKYEMIYQMTADALGYKNWNDTYTKVVKRLEEKSAKEGLTAYERKQLAQLENLSLQRAYMINGFGKKAEDEVKKEFLQYHNAKLMKIADEVEGIENFRMTEEGKRLSFTDNDRSVSNRKVNDKEPEMRTVRSTNEDENYEILEKIMGGLNKTDFEQLSKGEMEFFERTLDEVTPLLKTYFKRSYSDLSIPQRNMLVELAKKNQFLRSSGKPVIKEPSKEAKRKAALTKAMVEETKRIDAIEKVIGVNSDVVFKQADGIARGTVSATHIADDGRLTLDITTPDGTTIANVSSSEIQKVSEFRKDITPDEIIEKSTVNEMAIVQAEDGILALEKQRDELLGSATEKHNQLIAGYEKQMQDLEVQHAKEIKKLENKKGRNARTKVEIEHLQKVLDGKKADLTKRIADANKEHGARNVKAKKDLLGEYKERAGKMRANIRLYEELKQGYDNALKEGNFEHIDTLRHHMNQLDEILASDDALETFIRTQYKVVDEVAVAGNKTKKDADNLGKEIAQLQKENKAVADLIKQRDEVIRSMSRRIKTMEEGSSAKYIASLDLESKRKKRAELAQVLDKNHARITSLQSEVKQIMDGAEEYAQTIVMPKEHVVRAIDMRTDIPDTQKAWLEMLRGKMMEFAESEVAIGKLKPEQYERWKMAYLPHILTPEGEAFFKSKKNIDKHGNYLTQDMGYGMKTNPFAKGRTITKETTGKETDPTIAEINDYFRDALKGKNMFSENLSDIYVARALKNTELLYDNEYMDNMMNVFGDVIGREGVKDGYKAVMNVGKLKEMIYGEVQTMIRKSESEGIEVTDKMKTKWREDRLKYYKLDKGILDFEATPMVELTQEQLAKIGKVNPDNVRQVNDAIVHKANQARKLQIAKDRNKYLQMYDKFLHLVKINQTTVLPSFHVRNKLANLFNNWIEIGGDAVSKELHKDVYDALKHKGDPEKLTKRFNITKDGEVVGNMTMAEAYNLAKMHGVVDEGFFAADLGADAMVQGGIFKKVLPAKFNPLDTANNVLYKTGSKIGSFNENMDRTIHFVSQLRKGKTAEEASQSVNKVLFDYSDLTAFEQSVMKRLIPYYTFWKKNMKLQVTQVIDNPEKYRLAAKGLNAVEGGVNEEDKVDRNYVDPFAQDWAQTVFNYTNDKGEKEPVLWSPNLPFGDFNRIPNPFNPEGTANSVISQMTPLLKEPLEQLTNHSHFFNNELFYSKENENGEMVPDANMKDRLKHVGSNSGLFNLGEGIVNKDGMDLALHLLNYTTGLKYLSYDVEGKKRMEFVDKQEKEKVTDISEIADFEEKGNYIQTAIKAIGSGAKAVAGGISEGLKDGIESLGIPREELEEKADNLKWAVLDNAVMDATGLEEALSGKQFATGQITEVLDGDTVRAKLKNGKTIDVRVKLIDTPEVSHYEGEEAMPYGNQAMDFAKNKLMYQNARLIIEGKDVYGRSLAYIIANDENYNEEALREGMGKMTYLFDEYGNKDLKKYLKVQQEAYNNERGLWAKEGYANPDKDADFKWKASKDKK